MNARSRSIFLGSVLLITFGCQKQPGNPVTENTHLPPSSNYAALSVSFVDTLTRVQAEAFVKSLGLTTDDFSSYEAGIPHRGLVGVPDHDTKKWADSLLTYPIVTKVDPVVSVAN